MEKIKINEFKLIGLKLNKKTTNEGGQSGIDCGNLWQQFEIENYQERILDKLSEEVYTVYFDYEGDYTKQFSYFIGCKVKTDAETPQGMNTLNIPPGNYSKVIAKGKMPNCVANSWKEIWISSMERSYQFDFEIYDERSKDWSNAEIEIFVSSK